MKYSDLKGFCVKHDIFIYKFANMAGFDRVNLYMKFKNDNLKSNELEKIKMTMEEIENDTNRA